MANQHKNPNRSFRPPPDDWERFAELADAEGATRQELLNRFIAWYIGRPDIELPERPALDQEPATAS